MHPDTKRRKIAPQRRSAVLPSWAMRLRAGQEPASAAERDGYQAWRAGADVPGLPPYRDCREPLLCVPFRGGWGRGWL